jgi:hypothetical protein
MRTRRARQPHGRLLTFGKKMKSLVICCVTLVALVGCSIHRQANSIVAGRYMVMIPDHSFELTLAPSGSYKLIGKVWDGVPNVTEVLNEAGIWTNGESAIVLVPSVSTDKDSGYAFLRHLFAIRTTGGTKILVPPLNLKAWKIYQRPFDFVFYEEAFFRVDPREKDEDSPNKPSEPTPASDTPAATAPVAPPSGAAHS